MVGVGRGAENGILIKDAESLERAYKLDSIILDKTGTITEGKPEVLDIIWSRPADANALAPVLCGLEARSEHPLAEAVSKHLATTQVEKASIEGFKSTTGQGVEGRYAGRRYLAGSRKFMEARGIAISEALGAKAEAWLSQAASIIWFADDKEAVAALAVADKVKDSSPAAIRRLIELGITPYMLTGDNAQTAKAVAEKVGIKEFRAETSPDDKALFIQKLQGEGHVVAMVGDGINDSEALALADISIAMGKGTDIAMDAAKMTLISSDLASIPKAIALSRKTVTVIRQNLFWAFVYNLVGIPIAAGLLYPINGFLLNPMIAGAAMALSSVSVVTNSLRLRWGKL
jgi:Cu2+-exporting ATPase